MPVQIQMRRGTTAQWDANPNVVLAAGEIALNLTTNQFKIGNGSSTFANLTYQSPPANAVDRTLYTAKGTILAGASASTPTTLVVGSNNTVLVADSTAAAGVRWASSLSGLTLASPTLSSPTVTSPTITGTTSIGAGATLTSPTLSGGTLTSVSATNATLTNPLLTGPKETWSVSATAATGTVVVNALTATNWYYTSNASANWTFNFRGDASTTMNSSLATGQSITVGFLVTNGTTAYYPTAFQIDGVAVTPKWQLGLAPTSGNASSIDAYVFTIIKTASATYTVLASQTKFS